MMRDKCYELLVRQAPLLIIMKHMQTALQHLLQQAGMALHTFSADIASY